MAEMASAESNFLTRKAGPMPVWVWALLGLVVAWGFAKYRDLKSAAAQAQAQQQNTPGTEASSESQQVAPQFIIEENLPTVPVSISGIPSAPVTTPTAPVTPVVTPPSTAPRPPVSTKPNPPGQKTVSKAPLHYIVHHGDTLGSIAARYGTTWQKLYQYNTTPGVRPSSTIQTLKKRGPNLLYAGETILIPR